jgi:hypothetical protein
MPQAPLRELLEKALLRKHFEKMYYIIVLEHFKTLKCPLGSALKKCDYMHFRSDITVSSPLVGAP